MPRIGARALAFGAALLLPAFASARTQVPNAAQPQLAASTDGSVWLVYGQTATSPTPAAHGGDHAAGQHGAGAHGAAARPEGDIFVAHSTDGGETFAPATKVASVPGLMLGMRRGPRIAARDNAITVTVVANELVAFSSSDGGRTWSGPVTVTDAPQSAQEGLHDLAAAPDGSLFVTWLDIRNGKMELWGTESRDGGKTWAKNTQMYRSPDKSICECCHPSALFDADGNLAVMWRNSIEGSRDLWMAIRPRGAKEFSAAKKLGDGTWKLNACPMDGGKIVAMGAGKFGAVWQRAGEVFFAPYGGPEVLLGKGKQPVAITRDGVPFIVWQQDANLVSVRKPGEQPAQVAPDARFASAISLPNHGGVLAYEQGPAKEKQPGIVIERL
jgi:hypothetical protein